MENGNEEYDRFPVLDAAWPTVAPALPLFLAGPNDKLQQSCGALNTFLNFTGRWDEWLSLEEQAEAKALANGDFLNAGERARHAGFTHYLRRHADEVLACGARATSHWRQANAGAWERATAIRLQGLGHKLKRDYPKAVEALREALGLFQSLSSESEAVAITLNDLAGVESTSGDLMAAEHDYREALRVARIVGDKEGVAYGTVNRAGLAIVQRDWSEAETLAREAMLLSDGLGSQDLVARVCHRLAKALAGQRKKMEALPYAQRAVEIFTKLGSPNLQAALSTLRECEE